MTVCLKQLILLASVSFAAACAAPPPATAPDAGPDAGADTRPDAGESHADAGTPDAGPERRCNPPSEFPRSNENGYRFDGWDWYKLGLVPGLPQPTSAGNGNLAPALAVRDGVLHLWFTRKDGLQHRIWHTTSTDAGQWESPRAVTGLQGDSVVAYPSVVLAGERFRMFFASGSISVAESDDGDAWSMVKDGALSPEAGGFDSLTVLYPSAIEAAGALWYTGMDGMRYAIGRAVPDGADTWRRASANAVVGPREGDFDNRATAQPCVVRTGSRHLMWYGGYDTSRTDPGPWRIGLAESADGIVWTRRGLTIDLSEAGPDIWSARDPAVVRFGDRWLMAYAGMGNDSRYRLLLAESTTCAP